MLSIAANGALVEAPAHPGLLRLLEEMQGGLCLERSGSVEKYCGVYEGEEAIFEMDADGLWELLEQLSSLDIFI